MRHDLQKKRKGENGNWFNFRVFLVSNSDAIKKGFKLTRSEVLQRKREGEGETVVVVVGVVGVGVDGDVVDAEDDAEDGDEEGVGGGDAASSSSSSSSPRRRPPLFQPPNGRTLGRFSDGGFGDDVVVVAGRIQSVMAAFIQAIVSWVCTGKGRCKGRVRDE